MSDESSTEAGIITDSEADKYVQPLSYTSLNSAVLLELCDEISALKFEILLLKDEVIKNKRRITSLENEEIS